MESISFEESNHTMKQRQQMQLNSNLANLQKEIFDAIKYENIDKFKDLGGSDQFDLNFKIEVDDVDRTTYYPI